MSEINFELDTPIWQIEFFHNTPETSGYWTAALQAESKDEALEKAISKFEEVGLPPARILSIQVFELKKLSDEGGENGR